MIHVRRAGRLDARGMASLINQIIEKGGTTAYTDPIGPADLRQRMEEPEALWHVAENDTGEILGFQWVAPHKDLLQDSVDIASFVKIGATGLGIGSALFDATKKAVRKKGYKYIHAIIRADNESGLSYYQSRGFENFQRIHNASLDDGTIVDKIWKRYDLKA